LRNKKHGLLKIGNTYVLVCFAFIALFVSQFAKADEFLVNTTKEDFQVFPSVAALSGGGFVITWIDHSGIGGDDSASSIKAQLFDKLHVRIGSEFLVNTSTENAQFQPSAAGLVDGGFIIVWPDSGPQGLGQPALRAQRYNAGGTPVGVEFIVISPNQSLPGRPSVIGLLDGGFLVAWSDPNAISADTDSFAIYAQRYDQNSAIVGEVFLVNSTFKSGQFAADIASLSDGGFVITWEDFSQTGADTSLSAIRAQRYDASGMVQGVEFLVNTTTGARQSLPVVVGLDGGGFVIAWTDGSQATGTTFFVGADIRAQAFDAGGVPLGDEFVVNTTIAETQNDPVIAALSDGGFVITWDDASRAKGDESGLAIVGQRFSATGNFIGGEFLVNTTTFNSQLYSSVSGLADGGFAVAWRDNSGAGGFGVDLPLDGDFSASGIRADLFHTPGPTTLFSSVLPGARSGFIGGSPITVFASVINAGSSLAENCVISIPEASPISLSFQATDAKNQSIGSVNQSFGIPPGGISSFILSFSPNETNTGEAFFPDFVCDGSNVSPIPGVNTVFLSISDIAVPDILSISATINANGIVSIPLGSAGIMTASAINIGVGDTAGTQDSMISVSVDDGGSNLPLLLQLCETDVTGTCISSLGIEAVTTTIGADPSFFAVFVFDQASGGIPLDPANSRVFLRFTDQNGIVRSVTSSAVTVQ
jgi:hypothetical protein